MLIMVFFWVPSIVLDIVSINALRSVVISRDRTPDSFVRVQIKL